MRLIVMRRCWVAAVVMIAGCGRSSDVPPLGTVEGTVRLDGRPLTGVQVTFTPLERGRQSYGLTDSEGRYQLHYNAENEGAIVGEHRVTMITPVPQTGDPDYRFVDPVPRKYRSESTLVQTVQAGHNTCDFDLASKDP